MELFTIGVYGFNEETFFDTLREKRIDVFCDIRRRRGMRGAKYAFANSLQLQNKLQKFGIKYVHYRDLAPSNETRQKQKDDDIAHSIKKSERQDLSKAFIQAYQDECLSSFSTDKFIEDLGSSVQRIVLFCVERDPEACHRSLVSIKISSDLGVHIEHIKP